MKRIIIFAAVAVAVLSCGRSGESSGFSSDELEILNGTDSIMRVLTVEDSLDYAVLRAASCDFSAEELMTEEFERLGQRMVATVTHPSQDGVGIAGPQVGLNRRIVAVQRFDKEGEPFEVYANVRIVWMSDSLAYGSEGCLSVPDRRGDVLRSQKIVIEYADIAGLKPGYRHQQSTGQQSVTLNHPRQTEQVIHRRSLKDNGLGVAYDEIPMVRDTVCGFTAVIFQHEIDHLDGVLYIDRL